MVYGSKYPSTQRMLTCLAQDLSVLPVFMRTVGILHAIKTQWDFIGWMREGWADMRYRSACYFFTEHVSLEIFKGGQGRNIV